MTKKKNDSLTINDALISAWKLRKDYKGYDRSKGSSFNSWRAIINTAKGKSIGFPEGWINYNIFLSEVQGEWSIGKIVCRLDTKKPHSAINSYWSEKGSENVGKLIKLEYSGVIKTLLEWCAEYNLNYQGVRQRYFRGKEYTAKEILFGKERKTKLKHQRDEDFRVVRMFGAYKLRDKKRNLHNDITLEFFREKIKEGCIYCGDKNRVGFDRIDNNLGHIKSNVVPCCYVCNCARNDNFSFEEMKLIGLAIKEIKAMRVKI